MSASQRSTQSGNLAPPSGQSPEENPTLGFLLRQPSAFAPLLMSAAAFTLIVGVLLTVGVTHSQDEGTPAHIFQLLMVLQAPIIALFALRWVPQGRVNAVVVLLFQLGAAGVAICTVAWLEHLGAV